MNLVQSVALTDPRAAGPDGVVLAVKPPLASVRPGKICNTNIQFRAIGRIRDIIA